MENQIRGKFLQFLPFRARVSKIVIVKRRRRKQQQQQPKGLKNDKTEHRTNIMPESGGSKKLLLDLVTLMKWEG